MIQNNGNNRVCILHIGLHKTGTTSIQQFFYENRKKFLDYGVNYLRIPFDFPNHSIPFYALYSDDAINHPILNSRGINTLQKLNKYRSLVKEEVIKKFKDNSSQLMIISGEGMSSLKDKESINKLKNDLYLFFDKVIVIVYIREWTSYISSSISQLIRSHLYDIEQAIQTATQRIKDLPQTLTFFSEEFGDNNVLCSKYDPKNFPNNNVVLDLLEKIQLDIDYSQFSFEKRYNVSLSSEAIKILSLLNKNSSLFLNDIPITEARPIHTLLQHIFINIGHNRFTLSQDDINELYKNLTAADSFFKQKYEIIFEKKTSTTTHYRLTQQEENLYSNILELLIKKKIDESRMIQMESTIKEIHSSTNLPWSYYNAILSLCIHLNIDIQDSDYFNNLKKHLLEILQNSNSTSYDLDMQTSFVYHRLCEHELAIKEAKQAVKLDPDNPTFHHHLGNLLKIIGDIEGAEEAQLKALEIYPSFTPSLIQLSHIYNQLGDTEQAIQKIKDAIAIEDDNPHFYHQLGNLLRKNGDTEEAKNAQLKATELKPSIPGPHVGLSHIYNQLGDTELAIQKIKDAIAIKGDNPHFYHHLGNLLMKNGDTEEAKNAQLKAIELDSSIPGPHAGLSHIYKQLGDTEQAIQKIRDAIAIKGDNSNFYHYLSDLLEINGDTEGAKEAQEKALILLQRCGYEVKPLS